MEMSFIHMWVNPNLRVNKTNFHSERLRTQTRFKTDFPPSAQSKRAKLFSIVSVLVALCSVYLDFIKSLVND